LFGAHDKPLIETLGPRTSADMQLIKTSYQAQFSRDLVKDITDHCSGKFKEVLIALAVDPAELDAKLVYTGARASVPDIDLLSEVLCTRTVTELKACGAAYNRLYSRNMEADVKQSCAGDLEKVYMACISGNRGTRVGNVDADVEALHKAGSGWLRKDDKPFIEIVGGSTPAHVEALYWAYAQKYGKSLDKVIRSELSENFGNALATLVTPPQVLFAEKIFKAMKGWTTKSDDLTRLITSQRGRHLAAAGKYFLEVNKRTISGMVQADTHGDYRDVLMKICAAEGC